jgi:hypothetical protein
MKYRTTLLLFGPNNTGIPVPEEVLASFGRGKRPPVRVTVNGYTYRTTVAPYSEMLLMPFNAQHRAATGLRGGEEIEVDLVVDDEPREVAVPPDLAAALDAEPAAAAFFAGLSYTNRKSYVTWIEEAKKPVTRAARVTKAVEMLLEKRTR